MDAIITKKVRQRLIEPDDAYRMYEEIRNIPIQTVPYSRIGKLECPRLSKKGVIPYVIRDLQSLIWTGDTGSGSGMTV
ncbi:MAG: hypothetical protein GVY08_00925 [Bacteroidetes bacterium]|nr:hypothetical protein [Bacteroidota bacterium]